MLKLNVAKTMLKLNVAKILQKKADQGLGSAFVSRFVDPDRSGFLFVEIG